MTAPTAAPPAQQLPQDVVHLATAEGLGTFWETFLPKRLGAVRMTGLVLFALFGLALFVLPGLFFVWMLVQSPNLNRKQAAKRIHLFERGLIVADHTGPVGCFRWDSMAALQQITERYANGIHVGTSYLYTLYTRDGSTLKLTNFYEQPERWGAAIQQEITRAQLPGVLESLRRGETVRFGDLAVTTGGIATPKRGAVEWSQIQGLEVKNGVVFLKKSGKFLPWSNTQVGQIPNFFLFLATVDAIRRRAF
ncbi:DUF6585 family protein [Kitasatospora sp. NPDC059571]|uniref:DUF6585 family protein n=1 Tax=Kitasatospora sp. NPDC059571 TaxID=3346871 RepID=UPI0036A346BA